MSRWLESYQGRTVTTTVVLSRDNSPHGDQVTTARATGVIDDRGQLVTRDGQRFDTMPSSLIVHARGGVRWR